MKIIQMILLFGLVIAHVQARDFEGSEQKSPKLFSQSVETPSFISGAKPLGKGLLGFFTVGSFFDPDKPTMQGSNLALFPFMVGAVSYIYEGASALARYTLSRRCFWRESKEQQADRWRNLTGSLQATTEILAGGFVLHTAATVVLPAVAAVGAVAVGGGVMVVKGTRGLYNVFTGKNHAYYGKTPLDRIGNGLTSVGSGCALAIMDGSSDHMLRKSRLSEKEFTAELDQFYSQRQISVNLQLLLIAHGFIEIFGGTKDLAFIAYKLLAPPKKKEQSRRVREIKHQQEKHIPTFSKIRLVVVQAAQMPPIYY